MQTTVVLEDTRKSSLKKDLGERISLVEEVGHKQEVRTYERGVESVLVREESTLAQMVLAKDEEEVSMWYSEDIEPACTEHEVESKRDITPLPESSPTKKEAFVLTSKKEAYKKPTQERKLEEADIPSTCTEQKEVTTLSHPMTAIPPKKEVITPKKMESPREEITKKRKDIVPLEKPTPVSVSFEELVPARRLIPASREVSSPVPSGIPSPEKIVCLEEEISPLTETVMQIKKTSPALPKAVVAPKEDFPPEKVTLPKKPITKDKVAPTKKSQVPPHKKSLSPEEETLPSKTRKEVRTSATKPPQIGEDDNKLKKGTQEIEQQTLQKGILSYLSCTGS